MNIVLSLALTLAMAFILSACDGKRNDGDITNQGDTVSKNSNEKQAGVTNESKNGNRAAADVRIKLTFNNEEVIVRMENNLTSRDFVALLPLTFALEDYAELKKNRVDIKLKKVWQQPFGCCFFRFA